MVEKKNLDGFTVVDKCKVLLRALNQKGRGKKEKNKGNKNEKATRQSEKEEKTGQTIPQRLECRKKSKC